MNYNETLEKFDLKLLELMGIKSLLRIFPTVIEANGDNRVYLKFMSDGGVRDTELGLALINLLTREDIKFEMGSQARSFAWIDKAQLEKLVGYKLWEDDPPRQKRRMVLEDGDWRIATESDDGGEFSIVEVTRNDEQHFTIEAEQYYYKNGVLKLEVTAHFMYAMALFRAVLEEDARQYEADRHSARVLETSDGL